MEDVVADLADLNEATPAVPSASTTTPKTPKRRTIKNSKADVHADEEAYDKVKRYKQLVEMLAADLLAADEEEVEMVGDDDEGEIASDTPLAEYQRRLRRLKDVAVNTGGVTASGKIVRVGRAGPVLRKPREVTLDGLVKRIRISTPVVQETALDIDLRDLLLTYLILANEKDGRATVVPRGVVLHAVPRDKFNSYHESLTGVTVSNREAVRAALAKEGFDGRGKPLQEL